MSRKKAAPPDREFLKSALYRHGDVLVSTIDIIPLNAAKRSHLVLAEGEVTGHMHRIAEPGSAEIYQENGQIYLRVVADHATLIHPEHGPIALPRGDYRVWRQREYSPQAIHIVRD
jgi:hypothetical protein